MIRTQGCAFQDRFGSLPRIKLDYMSNQMNQNFTWPLFLATAILLWLISNFATFMHASEFNAPIKDSDSQRVLTVHNTSPETEEYEYEYDHVYC